jgi:hypothetical protein
MASLTRMTKRTAVRLVLAAASIGAGAVHLALAGDHYAEWHLLGAAFVAAGAFQLLWAVLIVVRDSRRALMVGGALSLVFLGTYLVSRTVGLPLGPEAFDAEPVGTSDLLCCALELPVALGALVLARRPRALRSRLGRRWTAGFAAGLVLVGTASGSALASPAHEHHAEQATTCPTAPVLTGELDSRGVDRGVTEYFTCRLMHEHDATSHAHH